MEDSLYMLQMMMIASWSIFMKIGRIYLIHQTEFIQWIVYKWFHWKSILDIPSILSSMSVLSIVSLVRWKSG